MNNGVFDSPRDAETDQAIIEIGANFVIEDQGTLDNYIRVDIKFPPHGKINIFQPHVIDQIVQ